MKLNGNAPYLIAVVVMFAIAVAGTVTLEVLNPDKDNTILTAVIIAVVTSSTPGILSFMKSQENSVKVDKAVAKVEEVHTLVNSKMEVLLEKTSLLAKAEGERIGREEADARTDKLTGSAASPLASVGAQPVKIVSTEVIQPVEIVKKDDE